MRPQALLLDFGGTLATERSSRAAIYASAAADHGLTVSESTMAGCMSRAHAELPREIDDDGQGFRYDDAWFCVFIERIFHGDLGLGREELPSLERELFARFSDAETFRIFPGALELLESAHAAGLALAVVSNWSQRLPLLLERLGLSKRLDVVLSSAAERLEKPDPRIFEHALEQLGVAATSAVHAGNDPEKDCGGARAAGLSAVLVDHSGTMPGVAPRVTGLADLADYLGLTP